MDYIYNGIMHREKTCYNKMNVIDITASRGGKKKEYKLYDSIYIKSNSHD